MGIDAQQIGRRSRQERRERSGRNLRQSREQAHVIRMLTELIIGNQKPKRTAAGCAKFFFVDFSPQHRTIKFHCAGTVASKLSLGSIEHSHLHAAGPFARCVGAGRLFDQPEKPPPGRLYLLKSRVVENGIELSRNSIVDTGDIIAESHRQFCWRELFTDRHSNGRPRP